MCIYHVYLQNGQEVSLVDDFDRQGGYEDIFTGTCCITDDQDVLTERKDIIHVYKFSASNYEDNFGESQTVYVYDSTCHNVSLTGTNSSITLKENYCFIRNQCFYEGEVSLTSCMFCNSSDNAYNWTEYNQCLNGGSCVYRDNQRTCDCAEGYNGSFCEIDIDECLSQPCKNNGRCTDVVNGYNCNCSDGFEGQSCETDINDCEGDPCGVGGDCVDKINGFSCSCRDGYTGDVCETDIDECFSQPCENGGTCVDKINSYNCTCVVGFEGTTCNADIDECASDPCQHNGSCMDLVSSYKCNCRDGFEGTHCEIDINECQTSPCQNDAECIDGVNQYSCSCKDGYTGNNCETEVNECQSNPCQNEAECTDNVDQYTCRCKNGYTGIHCETDINECQSNPCKNGAECQNGANKYTCMCKEGYEGVLCEMLSAIRETNVPLKQKKMQFVFLIAVTLTDLSDTHFQASVADEIVQYFLISVGESFKRVYDIQLSTGSLVVDFVAEYEDTETTASDFTKANIDLITGEKKIKLRYESKSPSTIKVGDKTVSSEAVSADSYICELFLEINGECPEEKHCVTNTRVPTCVDEKFGVMFIIVIIVCVLAAFILVMFIICFSIRGYILRKQYQKHSKEFSGSPIFDEKKELPHRSSSTSFSIWGRRHNTSEYIKSSPSLTEAEFYKSKKEL